MSQATDFRPYLYDRCRLRYVDKRPFQRRIGLTQRKVVGLLVIGTLCGLGMKRWKKKREEKVASVPQPQGPVYMRIKEMV